MPSNNRTGHNFVVPGNINANKEIYGMHISALNLPQHWYHAIALFKFKDSACANYVDMKHKAATGPNSFLSINYRVSCTLLSTVVYEGWASTTFKGFHALNDPKKTSRARSMLAL